MTFKDIAAQIDMVSKLIKKAQQDGLHIGVNAPGGLQVYADQYVPETQEVHRQERKWARRCMWKRDQRFTITTAPLILRTSIGLFAHPNTVERLKNHVLPLMGRPS